MANQTNATSDVFDYDEYLYIYYIMEYRYHVIAGMLTTCLVVVGVLGNLVALVVLLRGEMRRSAAGPTNLYLIAITALDTLWIVKEMLVFGLTAVDHYRDMLESFKLQFYPYVARVIWPTAAITNVATRWLMVLLAAERYLALCHPHTARLWCTMRRATAAIITVCGAALLYGLPKFFELEMDMWKDLSTNETYPSLFPSELTYNKVYQGVYFMGTWVPLMIFTPIVAMCTLAGLTCRRLATTWRECGSSNAQVAEEFVRSLEEERNLSLVASVMVVTYVACNTLHVILVQLVTNIPGGWSLNMNSSSSIHHHSTYLVARLLTVLNSSANLLVFVVFYKRFRAIFIKTFCSCLVKTQDPPLLTVAYHANSPSPL